MSSDRSEKSRISLGVMVFSVVYTILVVVAFPWLEYLLKPSGCSSFPSGFLMGKAGPFHWSGDGYRYYSAFFLTFAAVIVFSLIPKKHRFKPSELALMYSMIAAVPSIVTHEYGIISGPLIAYTAMQNLAIQPFVMDNMSPLLSPTNPSILDPLTAGGVAVPWGAWMAPLAFWILNVSSLYLFLVFWGGALSRLYIDTEGLAFPLARTTTTVISLSEPEETGKARLFKSKLLWIGALVGFFTMFLSNLDDFNLGAPILYGIDLVTPGIITAALALIFEPVTFGFALQLPNDILFSSVLAFVILYIVLLPGFANIGWVRTVPTGRHAYWFMTKYTSGNGGGWLATSPIGRTGYTMFAYGLMFAFVLYPIVVHRDVFANQLRSILNVKSEKDAENRYCWIGMIVCAVLYLGTIAAINVQLHQAILGFIVLIFLYTGMSRWYVETGGMQGNYGRIGLMDAGNQRYLFGLAGIASGVQSNPTTAISYQMITFQGTGVWQYGGITSHPMPWFLDSYAVGRSTGAKMKHVMISLVASVILSVAIGFPLLTWLRYTYGTAGLSIVNGNAIISEAQTMVEEGTLAYWPEAAFGTEIFNGMLVVFIIGAALGVLLYFGRARYGGFMNLLTPVGIFSGMTWGIYFWLPFIAALIVKLLAFRIGGSNMRDKVRLFGIGLMVGFALLWPVLLLGNYYRVFVLELPFS